MSQQINSAFEFGRFRLVPSERLLLRDEEPVVLKPKAFDTLVILVEHSGHIVKKDDLIKRVWPDAFVEESNLNHYISILRKALNDGATAADISKRSGDMASGSRPMSVVWRAKTLS